MNSSAKTIGKSVVCKCDFWIDKVSFLGHVVSEGGVTVDPSKVQDVLNWKPPQNVSEI